MTDPSDIHNAIAEPDSKVQPDAVPVCEYTGGMVMPATEGKPMLVFSTPDDGTVAVRLEDNDAVEGLIENLTAVVE